MQNNIPEFTVTEFSRAIKMTLEDRFGYVRIKGEVTGFKKASSGHYYFNLRENEPNIVIKYIKMRGNPAYIDFIKLYDDFEDLFAEVEEYFKQSIFHISTSYVK